MCRLLVCSLLLLGLSLPGWGEQFTITVRAGELDRADCPLSADIPVPPGVRGVRLLDETGREVPCQLVPRGNGRATLYWLLPSLAKGQTARYRAQLLRAAPSASEQVSVGQPRAGKVEIRLRGEPLLTYNYGGALPYPFFWPVIGPTGQPVTRAFPMLPDVPGETRDHTWHRSMWFTFGDVNGHNFWAIKDSGPRIAHRSFDLLQSGPVLAVLRTSNDWLAPDGTVVMSDVRELRAYATARGRLFDYEVTLIASSGNVLLRDTKEGLMAFRVATSMSVKHGGRLENSAGGVNEKQTFARRATWCDYSGKVKGKTVGIALLDHPANPNHPAYWFVRDYGLLACNPFGARGLAGANAPEASFAIPAGSSITLRFRIFLHRGTARKAGVAQVYDNFARRPLVVVSGLGQTPEEQANLPPRFRLAAAYDFEDGRADAFSPRQGNVWRVEKDPAGSWAYHLAEPGKQILKIRAPRGYAILNAPEVGDFVLTLRAKCERPPDFRGQDVDIYFGFRDMEHYYYVHFSNVSDDVHNAICKVNGKDRQPITSDSRAPAWLVGQRYHLLKLVRRAATGQISAYIDDMTEPVMTAWDKTFPTGRVGFGSFDDTGWFDDLRLYVPAR